MEVKAIRNNLGNYVTMDTECPHCGCKVVEKRMQNTQHVIEIVIPNKYCPECYRNSDGETKPANKYHSEEGKSKRELS